MAMFQRRNPPDTQVLAKAHGERLCKELTGRQATASDHQLYLLIDCGLAQQIQRFAQRRLSAYPHAVLLEDTPEAHLAARFSPWLVAIPRHETSAWQIGESDSLLRELCLLGQSHPAISWLWSSSALPDMASHLRFFMGGVLWNEHDGVAEGEVFLRYFDARILPGFMPVLTTAQWDALLRPIDAWCLWDRHLHWHAWQGAGEPVSAEDPTLLRYSLAQQQQLARQSQPDKILHLIHETHGSAAEGSPLRVELFELSSYAQYRRIASLVNEARTLGLASDADVMLFCVLALDVHPQFFAHPALNSTLAQGLGAGQDFSALLSAAPDSIWLELEQDRQASEKRSSSGSVASHV